MTSSQLSFSTIDVFTTEPFKGNQLAIVKIPHGSTLSQELKQTIAREFNYSETVFLHSPEVSTSSKYRIDIFTLQGELPFAGHPTIGSIYYICQNAIPPLSEVQLITKAGPLLGYYDLQTARATAEIPHNVRIHSQLVPASVILEPELLKDEAQLHSPFPLVSIVKGLSFVLIELPAVDPHLKSLTTSGQILDHTLLSFDEGWESPFVASYYFVILSRDETTIQVRTRMLEPGIGEDAATGSAASALASYLALKAGGEGQLYTFEIEQGVEMGRASQIHVQVKLGTDGAHIDAIRLGGSAVSITQGLLRIPSM